MRTNVRVGAIIERDGKMLLIHRWKNGDEYWVLVGGGVEEGEDLVEALKREVLEEASLRLKNWEVEIEHEAMGMMHKIFRCVTDEGEPVLGGPEKEADSDENRYVLEWVDFSTIAEIEDIYPRVTRELARKRIAK